jgi:hypothetical protein
VRAGIDDEVDAAFVSARMRLDILRDHFGAIHDFPEFRELFNQQHRISEDAV